jgi:drug/metabolite transporter (DMT)-like permease
MTRFRGNVMILGAAVLWGVSATAAKALFTYNLDTILVVQARVSVSFLILLLVAAFWRRDILRVAWRDLWKFALLGCIGVAGTNFTYYYTIKESTVATAILIQYTAPLLVLGYEVWKGQERITVPKLVVAVLSLLGCFLAVGGYDAGVLKITPMALLTGIGSIIGFAFLTVFTRDVLRTQNVWSMTFYSIGFASLFWLLVNPPWNIAAQVTETDVILPLVFLAVFSLLIPHSLFFAGLRGVTPSRAIITSTLEPVVAISSAAFFLGEFLQPLQVLGAVVVIGAIVVLQFHPEEHHAA